MSVSNRKWYNFLVIRVRSALSGGAYRIRIQRAEEEGIVCECQVDLKEIPAVDDIDLCVLFANTLDNAIEACSKMKERQNRHISVKARCMGGNLVMRSLLQRKIRRRDGSQLYRRDFFCDCLFISINVILCKELEFLCTKVYTGEYA